MAAGIDIAIVPLENNHFNRCKSNIKWLEYSACGIPGVYSDILPYNSCVTQGETGILVGSSTGEWIDALKVLISQEELRKTIGKAAQKEVITNYSLSSKAHIYSDFFRSMLKENNQTAMKAFRTGIRRFFSRSPFQR